MAQNTLSRTSQAIRCTTDAARDALSTDDAIRIIWLCPWCKKRNYTYSQDAAFTARCLCCERLVEVRLP